MGGGRVVRVEDERVARREAIVIVQVRDIGGLDHSGKSGVGEKLKF